ncbi:O-antigen ligase family protein [Roseimaritima ulvae]|uniref:O-Antigen ligase n=1 Tax=Roseimaritima ulvae TaxID=980254 RepID=A0A5B9R4H8_9BACT|nr:O-antigen ligase family protein [Roseimaritima ulvae]QEG41361.1 O-Antigen ligase [Roseimaritima ulvae]
MAEQAVFESLREPLDRQHARHQLVQKLAEWFVVVMAFFVPIVVVPVGERIGMSDPLLPALAVLLIFSRYRGRIDASHWLLLGFLAIAFLSLFQIHDQRYQVKAGLKWIRLVGICAPFFLGARMFVDRRLVRRAAWAFFWGGLIAILISLAVWWLQIPIRDAQQKMWYRGGGSELRAGGLVGETTHFGHLTATWITLVGSCLILARPTKHWKWLLVVLLGLGGFAIFAASSRSAVVNVAGTAGGIWAASRYRPRSLRNSVVVGLALALLLVLSFTALQIAGRSGALPSSSRVAKQIDRFLPSESNSVNRFSSGRIDSWKRYLRIAGNHVVLGCGYKNSPSLIPGRVPDNSVLSTLLETGVLGVAALTSFAIVLMLSLAKLGMAGNRYALLLVGVWCGQLLQAFLGDTYTLWLSMPVLYLITGLVLQLPAADDEFRDGPMWQEAR